MKSGGNGILSDLRVGAGRLWDEAIRITDAVVHPEKRVLRKKLDDNRNPLPIDLIALDELFEIKRMTNCIKCPRHPMFNLNRK